MKKKKGELQVFYSGRFIRANWKKRVSPGESKWRLISDKSGVRESSIILLPEGKKQDREGDLRFRDRRRQLSRLFKLEITTGVPRRKRSSSFRWNPAREKANKAATRIYGDRVCSASKVTLYLRLCSLRTAMIQAFRTTDSSPCVTSSLNRLLLLSLKVS